MLINHITSLLNSNLGHDPTESQKSLINGLADYILSKKEKEILLIKGYAGTGKTTIVSSVVKTLNNLNTRSVLMAPTGRAAKILTAYSGKNAFTIHKKIYRQKSSKDGFGEFNLDKNFYTNSVFIVDEASMITNISKDVSIFGSGKLLEDLLEYIFNGNNNKLILLGDIAQLPPVGLDISPALDKQVLKNYGYFVTEMFLKDVVRQSKDSGILYNATYLRNLITTRKASIPKFFLKNFTDIVKISGTDLLESITEAYNKSGIEGTVVIGRSNKMVNKYNQGIRSQILWREDEIVPGEYLMVVKNNYFWLQQDEEPENSLDFIANGDIVEVVRIHKHEEYYNFRFADVTIRLIDHENKEINVKILLDTLLVETAAMSNEDNRKLFYSITEEYDDVKPKKKRFEKVRNNPFFNALQVKYAYAVTCHKAQGGQWDIVFVDQGYVSENNIDIEYLRWLYTGITRSTKKLFLVNFHDRFFEDST